MLGKSQLICHVICMFSDPDDVDLWSAGVSELPAPGSMLGPVFSCIIATTFRDLKKGDRFWYENPGFVSSFTLRKLSFHFIFRKLSYIMYQMKK